MSSDGYIYARNWDKYQGRRSDRPALPWHKVYNDLLHDDAYCELTLAQRGLLHDLWTLISTTGDGHVRYSRRTLGRHLNVNRVSLEPLIQAGFIEIRDTNGQPLDTQMVSPELREELFKNKEQHQEDGNGQVAERLVEKWNLA